MTKLKPFVTTCNWCNNKDCKWGYNID